MNDPHRASGTKFGLQIRSTQHAAGNDGVFFFCDEAQTLTLVDANHDEECRCFGPRSREQLSIAFA